MTTVTMEKECGCFKRDTNFEVPKSFDDKADALRYAKGMARAMNEKFCGKHTFSATEVDDSVQVSVAMS